MKVLELKLKQIKVVTLFVVFFLGAWTTMFSQNQNAIYWVDDIAFTSENCMSNESNFGALKLASSPDSSIDSVKVFVEVGFKNTIFESLETFNDFDLEYWLLSINAFKLESPLNITIQYQSGSLE